MKYIRVAWVGAVLAASGGAAHAELLVTESTVDGVAMDATFADAHAFNVPEGKTIRFLKRPENTTHVIEGPYQGTLSEYTPRCGLWARLMGKCGPAADVQGGTRDAQPIPGGTKGLTPPKE